PRNRRAWLVVTAALSALLALLAVAFVASRFRPGGPLGTASPSAGAPPAATPVPVLPVSATASSTNPELARYRVGSTLDGDRATAWNSHGDKLRSNIGVRLTYRFAGPVKLARVTIINGYARTPALYRGNHRVARLSVRTDGGAATPWQLADTTDPQTLTLPGAPTTSITLVVEEIHQGNKYKDVAITEITFQSLP
ncbi:MAG TPA: hypothetical protein VES42_07325, partial [Pilimelia sp.]|nr:hypothetical protein [Pilimelia sp.]